jgi:DNA-binding beta-propeller fold protein YncE
MIRERGSARTFGLALWLALAALVVLPAGARAAGAVYVVNFGDSTVSQFTIGAEGELTPLTPATVATAGSRAAAFEVAVTPDGRSAYVTGGGGAGAVSQYDVDPLSGALSPKDPATVGGFLGAVGIAVTPDGSSAYVVDQSANTISQFDINPVTGALSAKSPATVPSGGLGSISIAVAPDGRSAYVTNQNSNTVSQYDIDPVSGGLSPKVPATVASGRSPQVVAVAPDSTSAYVTNLDDATVSQYDVEPLTGALSPKAPATAATGESPSGVAVTSDTRNAYVLSSAGVSQYDIDPLTGALSPKASPAVGRPGARIAVSRDGRSAYVTILSGNRVEQYDIDPASGTLSPKTPATVVTGISPVGIAVGPLPEHSTSTRVRCSPDSVAPGQPTTCTATVTDTAASGETTPSGTVRFTGSRPGSFSNESCTLRATAPGVAGCDVVYTPLLAGSNRITASYGGDSTHGASSGFTRVPPAPPAEGSVYVSHELNAQLSQYSITAGGELAPMNPPTVSAEGQPQAVAVTPDGKSLYVTNFGHSTVFQYDVDPATGALSPKSPATVAADLVPFDVAVAPDGESAYVTGGVDGTVWQYDIQPSTGALSPKASATVGAGTRPFHLAVARDGRSVYVTDAVDNSLLQYDVDPVSGALSPKSPPTVPAAGSPQGIEVTPGGGSVYVTTSVDNTVLQYDVDPLTGALSPKSPPGVPANGSPFGVAVTPDGRSAYVANRRTVQGGTGTVSQFDVDPSTGTLSPKSPAKVVAGASPHGVAVTPDGQSAYVTNHDANSISQYDVDPLTGALLSKAPAMVPTGPSTAPYGIAVGALPAPARHGTTAAVRCVPGTLIVGGGRRRHLPRRRSTRCSATVSDSAAIGKTTPTGTIAFRTGGPGRFRPRAACLLSEIAPGAARCRVTYRPTATPGTPIRTDSIQAEYPGDADHSSSGATTGVIVVSLRPTA